MYEVCVHPHHRVITPPRPTSAATLLSQGTPSRALLFLLDAFHRCIRSQACSPSVLTINVMPTARWGMMVGLLLTVARRGNKQHYGRTGYIYDSVFKAAAPFTLSKM